MATSIEVLRSDERTGSLALQKPLMRITPSLRFATQLADRDASHPMHSLFGRTASMVPWATEQRAWHLGEFLRADEAEQILSKALAEPLKPRVAAAIVASMLTAFGTKAVERLVIGSMVDLLLDGADIAAASELWRPVRASPALVALACRKLIATSTFPPRPAELLAACREANYALNKALRAAEDLVDFVRRCDSLLLQFDHGAWKRPYLMPQYRPILPRMLELHAIYGDGSVAWDEREEGHPFEALLIAEQAKLTLPPPEREAACEVKPTKLMRKPKGGG